MHLSFDNKEHDKFENEGTYGKEYRLRAVNSAKYVTMH